MPPCWLRVYLFTLQLLNAINEISLVCQWVISYIYARLIRTLVEGSLVSGQLCWHTLHAVGTGLGAHRESLVSHCTYVPPFGSAHGFTLTGSLWLPKALSVAWHRHNTQSSRTASTWCGSWREHRFINAPSVAWHRHTTHTLCITIMVSYCPGPYHNPLHAGQQTIGKLSLVHCAYELTLPC